MKATCLRTEGKGQTAVFAAAKHVNRTRSRRGEWTKSKGCTWKTSTFRPLRESIVERTRCRVADVESADGGSTSEEKPYAEVEIDCEADPSYTVISVKASNRPGLLSALTKTFRDLGIDVNKAVVDSSNGVAVDTFYVLDSSGKKITSDRDVRNIKSYIMTFLGNIPAAGRMERPALAFLKHAEEGTADERRKSQLLYNLMDTYTKNDVLSIQESIVHHVEYTLGRSRYRFDNFEAYQATALAVRDRLIEVFNDTQHHFYESDPKRVYYLSMEFLMGRSLLNSLYNLSLKDEFELALRELGYDLETVVEEERDAALGNGGLGRLAACFLDSMATLNLPAGGYGMRYQYGMFRQVLQEGFQHEQPDYWLTFGNPWEIQRMNVAYPVKFYGHVSVHEEDGRQVFRWNAGETIEAVAYDNPVPGYNTDNTINLRLWSGKPDHEFDLESFNTGDYVSAILAKQRAETISSVLYPDDRTYEGKELRLRQQHFMVSASLQDMLRRFKSQHGSNFDLLPEKVALQLNDTHPTIGVPELMRLLMDENGLGWTKSWELATKIFSFTNHTVLPEALEKWPVSLIERLLPRHMQIIYDINWRFLQSIKEKVDDETLGRLSIIEDSPYDGEKFVRMAYLAMVASHTVNGVAAIHSELIKETIFADFYKIWPEKFQNKTNGVTQRRWLAFCNPKLRSIISETLGTEEWITNLDLLTGLKEHADDPELQRKWQEVKQHNKAKLAELVQKTTGISLPTNAMYDIQVKRIHEYKRQLLNILSVIDRYARIRGMSEEEKKNVVPRVVIVGGKAAPGYDAAKRIIKLVSAVGDRVNNDPAVGDLLKVVFIPDYNVSLAETIIPGSELSQHISTAGTEASGTSNMKFAMNGSLIIGTMDGANVEIAEEIGEENMFIFGVRAHEVPHLRATRGEFQTPDRFNEAVGMISRGEFGWSDFFQPLVDNISGSTDFYLLANDFLSYLEAQEQVDAAYRDQARWTKMSILSTAGSGKFSSDRTIQQYAKEIWGICPCCLKDA